MNRTLRNLLVSACALFALGLAMSASAGDAAAGKAKYDMFCASCHGPEGKGDGPVAVAINPPPRDFSEGAFKEDTDEDGSAGTDADLSNVIANGAAKYGGKQMMAPWGGTMSAADLDNVGAFIHSLKQ